jgi:hypothetical protein
MSRILPNGYTVVRVRGRHLVNGEPVRSFRDDAERVIVISDDDGSRDALVDRTAEAVGDCYAAAARAERQHRDSAIEVLYGLRFRKVPLIPDTEQPRLPYEPPSAE